ncbi:MAG: hypothetical protein ABI700_20400 [Chloroflexota bacterium]
MDELREHLSNSGNFAPFYLNEATGITEYNHLIAFTYAKLAKALEDGADRLEVRKFSFCSSRQGEIINEWNYHFTQDQVNFAVLMRKIIKNDSVVREHVKVDDDHYSHITIKFL